MTETERVVVLLESVLVDALERQANGNRRTVSDAVRTAVIQHLSELGYGHVAGLPAHLEAQDEPDAVGLALAANAAQVAKIEREIMNR
jgi:hypothetical protein